MRIRIFFGLAGSAALLASAPALAQTGSAAAFATAKPVAESQLARQTGRENLQQVTVSDQTNEVSGNSVGNNSHTGRLTIDGNAFQNMNGFSILNANTGNNVAINASIQVNIAMPAAPAGQ